VEKCHDAIRPHGVSAFSVEMEGSEKLVLMMEIEPKILRDMTDDLRREIRRAVKSGVSAEHDLSIHDMVFVGRLPRTTSGKIKHHQCKKDFLAMLEENKAG
jgi:acyl-coenzyme A synthetase/AMP-(fatty) acid ligase